MLKKGKYVVEFTIKKNKEKIPTGTFKRYFITNYGAQRFITDLLHSRKKVWYKYATKVKSNSIR